MKSICICGSKRFKSEIHKFSSDLNNLGITVYAPFLHSAKDEWSNLSNQYQEFIALGLTHDHFYKIKIADVIYIYNKNGYAGVSTTMEIAYAVALGKPVYAYSNQDDELCRRVLFRGFIKTPKSLLKILK